MKAVVIGTGPAGITAALTLRANDPTGTVSALCTEPYPPYSPAAMADHFLTGRTNTLYWKGVDVAARWGITERREAPVVAIDVDNHEVVLHDESRIGYEGLVIASGSRLHAPLEGVELPGVLDFKSLRMAEHLVAQVHHHEARSAVIVGNGLIGVELSLLLAGLGVQVTVIGRRTWVMPRILDPETAAIAEAGLRARGVQLELGVEAQAFIGGATARGVRLADGRELDADLVIAATGVKPHVEFLGSSGIVTGWGVHVDDRLRTSAPDVVAAGDVAEAADWLTGKRFVHANFPNAVGQAKIAARNLLGAGFAYDGAEAMNSLKHLGIPIVAMGTLEEPDEIVRWRANGVLRSVYLRGATITGVQLAGDITSAGLYRSLMLRRADVSAYRDLLATPTLSVADVVGHSLVGA
ncbi:MAG TPA: FAD-dependent oxidoreductase [Acidimicrobiales bacterium]|nr:FAD-dependent oxidoreductase [Acidimicrobiales bacterium]